VIFQDDIRSVQKEGRLLLSNLETVKASKRDVEEERDLKSDMGTVQRYTHLLERGLWHKK